MAMKPYAQMSHLGLAVYDFDKMLDFYLRFFDYHISDQQMRPDGRKVAFLTRDPNDHHQFVLGSGRPKDADFNPVTQISFRTDSLASVKEFWRSCVDEPEVEIDRTITHGNAWSVYFRDPEGNRLEIYADTPWQVTQPYVVNIDLSQSDEEIYDFTDKLVHSEDYCEPFVDWRHRTAKEMGLTDWPIRE